VQTAGSAAPAPSQPTEDHKAGGVQEFKKAAEPKPPPRDPTIDDLFNKIDAGPSPKRDRDIDI